MWGMGEETGRKRIMHRGASKPKKAKTGLLQASTSNSSDSESSEWFTSKRYPSDITLKFDDTRSLYVAKEFLMYSSPVFEAMFTHEMKEKLTGIIELNDKRYTDFLELLLCLHPRVCKPVTSSNAYPLAFLAIEYQMQQLLERCKTVLRIWMRKGSDVGDSDFQLAMPAIPKSDGGHGWGRPVRISSQCSGKAVRANAMLKGLHVASMANDGLFLSEAANMLSDISYYYVDGDFDTSDSDIDILQQNKRIFSRLGERMKMTIYKARLKAVDTPR